MVENNMNKNEVRNQNIENKVEEVKEQAVAEERTHNWVPWVIAGAVAVVIFIAVIIAVVMKNDKEADPPEPETTTVESVVEEEPSVEEETEQAAEETSVEEETTAEETEEAVLTMEKRLTELGLQGICVVVWNDANTTEHIIEEGEKYEEVAGDRFFICTPSRMFNADSFTTSGWDIGESTENYCEMIFGEYEEENIVELTITCKDGEEADINFFMTASQANSESGYDWAESLVYDEPKMVVWNDTTGLRKELEEGETYQLLEGDEVAMYMPEGYLFNESNVARENIVTTNVAKLKLDQIDLGDKLDLEMSIMHNETYETIAVHVTLLPPTE